MMSSIYESALAVAVFKGESGILDIVPIEEMEAWLDAPRQDWRRDGTYICEGREPPHKAFVEHPQTMAAAFAAYFNATMDPRVERADPRRYTMWVSVCAAICIPNRMSS